MLRIEVHSGRCICPAPNKVRLNQESSDAIETNRLRQAFNVSKRIHGSVGIDDEDADSAGSGIESEQVFTVATDCHVEIGSAFSAAC